MSLTYLLVIANPDAITPYDPSATAIPGSEHYVITSQRRGYNPWIAQRGEGPDAGPDIDIGGQRLELPLGRTVDGECQVRVIDVAAPLVAVACDINSVLIPEGEADLHLDSTAFTSGKWVRDSNTVSTYAPEKDWGVTGAGPGLGTFGLFFWVDDPGGPPYMLGPWLRHTWIEATFDGTEGGGVAWTAGQKVGFRFRVNWTLDTGGGNVFVELQGAGSPVRVSGLTPSFNFWDMPQDALNNQVDLVVYAVADTSGEVVVRLGAENMYPSFNLAVSFTDMEVVECDDILVPGATDLYTTSFLADEDARQQMLGWPYYLKSSTDGGLTFDAMLYAGYLRNPKMELAKTFLMIGGDAGRGRRVSSAWKGLDPVEDFTP